MNFNSELTARRMGYGEADTYSAIGLMIDGRCVEFALVQQKAGGSQQVVVHDDCDPNQPNDGGCDRKDFSDFDSAMKAFNEAFRPYLIGRRVRFAADTEMMVDRGYIFRKGESGRIKFIDGYLIAVQMDTHYPILEEWDNELHWHEEAYRDADGREWPSIEALLRDVEFIDGDVTEVPAEG